MKKFTYIWLFCFTSIVCAKQTLLSYTSDIQGYYLATLKTAHSDPQKALASLQNHQPNSPIKQAQHEYLLTTIYANLDYPEKMLEHSNNGIEAISITTEPWMTRLLQIAKADALDRKGIGMSQIATLKQVIEWAEYNKHHTLAAAAYIQLSNLYINVEDFNQALQLIQQAADIAPQKSAIINQSEVASHIAAIYVYRNEFALALPYFKQAYELDVAENDTLGMSISLFELGRANLELDNHELGVEQLQESIKLSRSLTDHQGVAYANAELAYYYIEQEDHTQAKKLITEAIKYFNQAGNSYSEFDALLQLCQINTETGDFTAAQKHLDQATELMRDKEFKYGSTTIDKMQAELLAAQGNYQAAFDMVIQAHQQEAILRIQYSSDKLHEIRSRYEVEKNLIENQLLLEQNRSQSAVIANQAKQSLWLNIFIALLAALVAVLIWFISRLHKQRNKLHELANYDGLTGLMNRHRVISSIRKILLNMSDEDTITMVMIDLDKFKSINDTYGHQLGDKVLSQFGQICTETITDTELIGRLGGEEFLIAFINTPQQKIQQLIEQLRLKTLKMSTAMSAPGLQVSLSAGVCHSHKAQRFRDILKCADDALYHAKNQGRNQIATVILQ